MTRTDLLSAHLRWCNRPPGFAVAILFLFFAAPSWGKPVEQGLQTVIYPDAFTFAADQLTAAPFAFGPYDLNTDYECYRRLDVEDFNLTVEIASAAVTMERDTLSLDVELGTVRGTDIDVSGVSGFLDLCLDFDATIEYVQLIDGQSHTALAACDLTLVASGTATLEAALFKRPMVIAYRMNRLNWWRMKGKGLLPWVGLPNILAREFLVPELIQGACTPENLAREAEALLADAPRRAALQARFVQLHELLRQDTARRASDAIAQLIQA